MQAGRVMAALFILLGALFAAPVFAQDAGRWEMKAPAPASLSEVSVVLAGGKVHLLGGSVLGFTGPYHLEYDPASDKWAQRAAVPRSLDHMGAAVLNGKIYLVGGFIGGTTHNDGQNAAMEYDPALDSWRLLASMKAGRGSVGVAAVDGKLYAIGGREPNGAVVSTNEVYDPSTNRWKALAPLPRARDHFAIGVVDGKIHVAGGRFGPSTERTGLHDVYDPVGDSWTSAAPLPTPRSGLAGTVYKGLFMVLGGEFPGVGTNAENEAYDARSNSWRALAPMPAGRHATMAATDGEHVYLADGSLTPGGAGATNQLIMFTLP
jgi:N-acetylneuraminic acid mutarotase